MEFSLEHRFPAPAEAVLGAMIDAPFYATLVLPDLSLPELVGHFDDGVVGELALRYTYIGRLDPLARSLLGGGELVWTQQVRVDRAACGATLSFAAERDPARLYGHGEFVVAEDERGWCRTLHGEVVVAIPIVGPAAERAILGGLRSRLDLEAEALAAHVAAPPSQP